MSAELRYPRLSRRLRKSIACMAKGTQTHTSPRQVIITQRYARSSLEMTLIDCRRQSRHLKVGWTIIGQGYGVQHEWAQHDRSYVTRTGHIWRRYPEFTCLTCAAWLTTFDL